MDASMDDNSEDLILYEATVMVRKTLTRLNLNLKRPMKSRGRAVGETKEVILGIIVLVPWSIVVISGLFSLLLVACGIGRLPISSFKRLPSQTLGADISKHPYYGFRWEVEHRNISGWVRLVMMMIGGMC